MYPKGTYVSSDSELSDANKHRSAQFMWTVSGQVNLTEESKRASEREYDYDEAIELAGSGWYTLGLLATMSCSLLAMCVDLFSFSTVVALSACDLHLTPANIQILISVPFVGPIIMSFVWGYVADTGGRRRSLLAAMTVSWLAAALSALSPHWTALAALKLIGTCFSSCAQSVTYTLLGESCPERLKGTYLLVMTSVMHLSMGVYFAFSYFVGYLDFALDLGFIVFVPWRLLIILLSLPLGVSALALVFFYESPKFLINAGREQNALMILENICRRNEGRFYPVRKVTLKEVGNVRNEKHSLVASLWQRTAPLFRPPMLSNTLLLYCLIFIVYSSSSALCVWIPFLARDFTRAVYSEDHHGICFVCNSQEEVSTNQVKCTSKIDLPILIFAACVSGALCILNFIMSKLASRKKVLMIAILVLSSACCLTALHVPNNLVNIVSFFGVMADSLSIGVIFAYFVDLYPTSFRGMVSCLGVMVARVSSIGGLNLIGPFISLHCSIAFYALCAFIFSGALLSYFLPPDRVSKV